MGSEMCIRDSSDNSSAASGKPTVYFPSVFIVKVSCLLYTSDAADDLLCVDLGGLKKSLGEVTRQVKSHSVSNSLTGGEWRIEF